MKKIIVIIAIIVFIVLMVLASKLIETESEKYINGGSTSSQAVIEEEIGNTNVISNAEVSNDLNNEKSEEVTESIENANDKEIEESNKEQIDSNSSEMQDDESTVIDEFEIDDENIEDIENEEEESSMVIEITSSNYANEVENFEGKVFLDFYATWCGPCKMMTPVVDELSTKYTNVKFGRIDVDEEEDLAIKYGITAMPTFIVVENGEVKGQIVGAVPEDELEVIINK